MLKKNMQGSSSQFHVEKTLVKYCGSVRYLIANEKSGKGPE